MKAINTVAGLALAAYAVLALGACSQTSNGTAAATPTCTVSPITGAYVDQNGNPCSSATGVGAYGCSGYTYSNGQYYGSNGVPVNCGSQYVIPPTGYSGSTYVGGGTSGCQQWTQIYGIQYVPVNLGGELVCVNYNYLTSQSNFSSYNSAYSNPAYWYQYPPTAYQSGYYGGYGYQSCAADVNLGFSTGSFGAGVNLCF